MTETQDSEAGGPETDRGRAMFEELLWVHAAIRRDLAIVEQDHAQRRTAGDVARSCADRVDDGLASDGARRAGPGPPASNRAEFGSVPIRRRERRFTARCPTVRRCDSSDLAAVRPYPDAAIRS